jgi:hypothetical protein
MKSKLSDMQREEIRSRFRSQGRPYGILKTIAEEYGVKRSTIFRLAEEVTSPSVARRIINELKPAKSASDRLSLCAALADPPTWLNLAGLPRELLGAYGYHEIGRALAEVSKMASDLAPAKVEMDEEEKAAFDQGAAAAVLLAEAGAAGEQEPQMPGPEVITEEDVLAVLEQMIQSGELTPDVAVEILRVL